MKEEGVYKILKTKHLKNKTVGSVKLKIKKKSMKHEISMNKYLGEIETKEVYKIEKVKSGEYIIKDKRIECEV